MDMILLANAMVICGSLKQIEPDRNRWKQIEIDKTDKNR